MRRNNGLPSSYWLPGTLATLLLFGLLHYGYSPSSNSFKALVGSHPEGIYPLEAASNVQSTSTVSGGTAVILAPETREQDLRTFLCDVYKISSNMDQAARRHDPSATRHITLVVPKDSGSAVSKEGTAELVRVASNDKQCSTSTKSQLSISVVAAKSTAVPSLLDQLNPRLILATREKGSEGYGQSERPGRTWIDLPNGDLRHAAWILALPAQALEAWHTPQSKILIITHNRPTSLKRLYKSLQTAHYFGDKLDLNIKIEATADPVTLDAVRQMSTPKAAGSWQHGSSSIAFRFRRAGLISNIVEAWWPGSNDEYGFFFEDDIEASPFFYAWAKWAILMYRYGPDSQSEAARNMYGVSLIQQKTSELDRSTGRILWDASSHLRDTQYKQDSPYLSQVPSSWGAVFFPEAWREFHEYIQIRHDQQYVAKSASLVTPVVVSNSWEGSWKRYLIELVFLRGYTMLYPNYPDFVSLSTNHVELGEHIDPVKQAALKRLQMVPLMAQDTLLDMPGNRLPELSQTPFFDLWGRLASGDELAQRGLLRRQSIWKCENDFSRMSDYNATSLFGCGDDV